MSLKASWTAPGRPKPITEAPQHDTKAISLKCAAQSQMSEMGYFASRYRHTTRFDLCVAIVLFLFCFSFQH